LPALVISPFARRGQVDHRRYDTTSILALIEHRFGLVPLSSRDRAADPLSGAFDFGRALLEEADVRVRREGEGGDPQFPLAHRCRESRVAGCDDRGLVVLGAQQRDDPAHHGGDPVDLGQVRVGHQSYTHAGTMRVGGQAVVTLV
jgi:Phosphoesterase family